MWINSSKDCKGTEQDSTWYLSIYTYVYTYIDTEIFQEI